MLEQVAKAMAENAGFRWQACTQSQWLSDARAGIEALRDPPDAVLLAAGEPYGGGIDRATGLQIRRDAWNKMLDAIVAEVLA